MSFIIFYSFSKIEVLISSNVVKYNCQTRLRRMTMNKQLTMALSLIFRNFPENLSKPLYSQVNPFQPSVSYRNQSCFSLQNK